MFHEIRHAALLAKAASRDAEALAAHTVLAAATLGGARALGLDAEIGSLVPGKAADMCAVRLDDWLLQPCYDAASHLVYAAGREQVSAVWVAGEQVVSDGIPSRIDVSQLRDIARLWHTRLTS
jgi:5-methylthioadenosine/S-adenosylhomocysteine deaminase